MFEAKPTLNLLNDVVTSGLLIALVVDGAAMKISLDSLPERIIVALALCYFGVIG